MTIVYEAPRARLPSAESTASFWHREPSQFLLGHRTTPDLPTDVDVVIVGSGITGASAARFLAEDERSKDMSILMLEAREACWGATGRVRLSLPTSVATLSKSDFHATTITNPISDDTRMVDTASLSSTTLLPTSPHLSC